MERYMYRQTPLDFHSNFEKEDIGRAEQVLADNGIANPASMLDKVCKLLFNVSPYEDENLLIRKDFEEFEVIIDMQAVIDAENCLKHELGENADEEQIVLQAVCYTLVDLEIYDEEYDDDGNIL